MVPVFGCADILLQTPQASLQTVRIRAYIHNNNNKINININININMISTCKCKRHKYLEKGYKAPSCIHRAHNSAVVLPLKPQISAPTMGIPNKEKLKMCETESAMDS